MSVSQSASRAGAAADHLHIELTDVLVSSYATGRSADDTLHIELSDVLVSGFAAHLLPGDAVQLVGVPDVEAILFA